MDDGADLIMLTHPAAIVTWWPATLAAAADQLAAL
jgi:hypothetical protein